MQNTGQVGLMEELVVMVTSSKTLTVHMNNTASSEGDEAASGETRLRQGSAVVLTG